MNDDVDGDKRNPKSEPAADHTQAQQTGTGESPWHGIVNKLVIIATVSKTKQKHSWTFGDLYSFAEN